MSWFLALWFAKIFSRRMRRLTFAGELVAKFSTASSIRDHAILTAALALVHRRQLDMLPWCSNLSRRVQHFGHVFDYVTRAVDFAQPCRPFPAAIQAVADRALAQGLISSAADQCTVNEYLPGQVRPRRACSPAEEGWRG